MATAATVTNKKTIPILFNAGSYGTFVEWCVNYFFSNNIGDNIPFNTNGNSHTFGGNHLTDMNGWRQYLVSENDYQFARLHPKTSATETAEGSITEILQSIDRLILLFSEHDSTLLCLNNKFEKVHENGWLDEFQDLFADSLVNWGKQSITDMEPWEIREFLSLYIHTQHLSEFEVGWAINYHNPRVLKVDIRSLITDFEKTITQILNFCGLDVVHQDFNRIYQSWVVLQKHIHKDQIVSQIIHYTINDILYDWTDQNLSIVDESFIQMGLRDSHNLDLLCYNLNVFPSNTKDLRKLLINV